MTSSVCRNGLGVGRRETFRNMSIGTWRGCRFRRPQVEHSFPFRMPTGTRHFLGSSLIGSQGKKHYWSEQRLRPIGCWCPERHLVYTANSKCDASSPRSTVRPCLLSGTTVDRVCLYLSETYPSRLSATQFSACVRCVHCSGGWVAM